MMQQKHIVGALQAEQNAKAQAAIAKAAQADMTQEEKLSAYKQTAGYIARQESYTEYYAQKAMEAQRAGERNAVSIAEEYKVQEQARQSAGGKVLAMPFPQEPNPLDYEDCKPFDLACHARNVKTWWDNLGTESSQSQPTATPTLTLTPVPMTQTPTKTLHPDVATIIALQTANTPLPTMTPLPTLTPQVDINYQLGRYGISIIGNVDSATLQVALDTANLLGKNYMPFLNASTPESAFLRSNGQVLIILDDKATFFYQEVDRNGNTIEKVALGNCETKKNILQSINEFNYIAEYKINTGTKDKPVYKTKEVQTFVPQTIVCKNPPTEENLMHEFGHTTPNHVVFDIFSNVDKILKIDGKYLDYNEDGGYWEREETGFLKGNYSLEHQITVKESRIDGTAKLEQLADMLMNWNMEQAGSTQYGFANDVDGNARRDYILNLIREMLAGR